MHFLYDLPEIVLFLVVLLPCLGIGLAGLWLVRSRNWTLQFEDDNGAMAVVHAFVGVLYAVALGLMVIGVQGSYADVEMAVMREAALSGDLYVDANGLEPDEARNIQALLQQYLTQVIQTEWVIVSNGEERAAITSGAAQATINRVSSEILQYTPQQDTPYQQIIYAEVLTGLNDLLDQRRTRLHLGSTGVSSVTWSVIIFGALITIGILWFYRFKSEQAHYGLVGVTSLMFGLMIFLIVAMDHPLWGDFSVSCAPFAEELAVIAEVDFTATCMR
ncbi:MAG: hypothetical protein ACI95C_000245 [Pseudohongiellaceae bacterium]|jgi:hypothetical protein